MPKGISPDCAGLAAVEPFDDPTVGDRSERTLAKAFRRKGEAVRLFGLLKWRYRRVVPDDSSEQITLYRLKPSAVDWRIADGEVVALDVANSRYLAVNRSGAVLWPLLAEGATRDRLRDALVERYGQEEEVATKDVRAFLGWLDESGLLELKE